MNKELKVGLVALSSIMILIFGVNYLKGLNILNDNRIFYAVYDDIGGLQLGSPILVNGYHEGMVGDINLIKSQKLLVDINIEHDFEIPKNTVCKIVNRDLMGTKGIVLLFSESKEYANDKDTLLGAIEGTLQDEVNAQILPLKNKAEELISSVDSVMTIVTAVLNKETRESLSNSLQSLDKTFNLMSNTMIKVDSIVAINDQKINKIISNIESISTGLNQNQDEFNAILNNFSAISDSLAKSNLLSTINNLNDISNDIKDGKGSLGMLVQDSNFYDNLEKSTKQLEELIEDIKENPQRYVNFSILGSSKSYKKTNNKKK